MAGRRALISVIVLLLPTLLAGCTSLDSGNFTLKATKIGWNIGARANFSLTLEAGRFQEDPVYTIDPLFAIEEVAFERAGANVFGDYSTKTSSDVGLRLLVAGKPVETAELSTGSPTVIIQVTIPDSLEDDTYHFVLKLFEVGTVESNAFRVNRP